MSTHPTRRQHNPDDHVAAMAEIPARRDGVGEQLAEDIAAVRSSARMLVDVLSK